MSAGAFLFFALFAGVQLSIYFSIRKEWFSAGSTAGVGVLTSIICAVLISLAQGNIVLHALIVGLLLGGIISGATLSVAWYFQSNELRKRYYAEQTAYPADEAQVYDYEEAVQ